MRGGTGDEQDVKIIFINCIYYGERLGYEGNAGNVMMLS